MLVRSSKPQPQPHDDEQDVAHAKPKMPRFGVAIFDNPRDPVGGWGCLADGESFRFRQPSDLTNDCLWVCTADGMEYTGRMAKMHHLRPADFLRSSLKHIAADLGLHIDGEGRFGDVATVAAPTLAKVIYRTILIAVQIYGWNEPQQYLRANFLYEDIRKSLVMPPAVRPFMRAPLMSAYQNYSSPDWSSEYEADSVVVTLRLNRLAHARKIMLTQVPDGAWTYVDSSLDMNTALDTDAPCLVEASVETSGMDPAVSSLVAFGSQPGRRSGLRSWICQRELAWLNEHAKVTITRAYRAPSSALLPERSQLPELLVSDPLFELSLSAGLVAESHWTAFCNPVFSSKAIDKKEVTPWGVWLRAADRAMSFDLALRAHRSGFHVLGYGNGSVVVRLQRPRLPELLEFAMGNDVAHPVFREIFEVNGLV